LPSSQRSPCHFRGDALFRVWPGHDRHVYFRIVHADALGNRGNDPLLFREQRFNSGTDFALPALISFEAAKYATLLAALERSAII
jgi:hypothetical protein